MLTFSLLSIVAAASRKKSPNLPVYEADYPALAPRGRAMPVSMLDHPMIAPDIERMGPAMERKYRNLEKMMTFIDTSSNNITRYWVYGCWCFQMGDFPMSKGVGAPQDNVDKTCKHHKECYMCAKKDHGQECVPEETGYRHKGAYDKVTGDAYIECKDPVGTCKRQICECDKALAERLEPASTGDNGWNAAHHAFYGGFDSRSKCLRMDSKGPGNDYKVQCCGKDGDRVPYKFHKDGSGKQCCGGTIFDSDIQECCSGDQVASIGSC